MSAFSTEFLPIFDIFWILRKNEDKLSSWDEVGVNRWEVWLKFHKSAPEYIQIPENIPKKYTIKKDPVLPFYT